MRLCAFLESKRFSRLPADGRVLRRIFGSFTAASTIARSFSIHAMRLANCDRSASATINKSPSTVMRFAFAVFNRNTAAPVIPINSSGRIRSSAFELTLLTFCPPGPPERAKCNRRSSGRALTPGAMATFDDDTNGGGVRSSIDVLYQKNRGPATASAASRRRFPLPLRERADEPAVRLAG